MVAWIVVSIWNLLTLAIAFGPLVYCFYLWDRVDRRTAQWAHDNGLPEPKAPPQKIALRWAIGIGLFVISGYIATVMYEASEGLYWSIERRANF